MNMGFGIPCKVCGWQEADHIESPTDFRGDAAIAQSGGDPYRTASCGVYVSSNPELEEKLAQEQRTTWAEFVPPEKD
jgi:hypothetical protein